ncbi:MULTISPECIES: TenA family protein [unclassified Halomonas]|uniref:TenA family protein n=1 Tax=unclassified Halomonas TaxID=2609666 RepID=UPI0021E444B8|nr:MULTISPECIES: TenA family protein [unclassified Halomonas]UYG01531.1 TenA family protein [Halomonas sp. GD1P12]WNL37412.1 TenA family protein [Halomonas sp. PAMB 3232]
MDLCQRLRQAANPYWDASVNHRFVDELLSGHIDDEVFARYLVQDFCFCDSFVRLLGAAVCAADDPEARLTHARQLSVLAGGEYRYFIDSFQALGVAENHWRNPPIAEPTQAFVELMDRACASQDYALILVVLVVAEWLYLEWAQRSPTPPPERAEHRDWIVIHNEPAFVQWVDFLKSELNRVGETQSFESLRAPFVEASRIEKRFFDMAYDGPDA